MNEHELLAPTKIILSKRKSISLCIKNNGDFIVKAPAKCSQNKIYDFIKQKADWIIKKRTEQFNSPFKPLTFDRDESINILGKPYNLVMADTSRVKLTENQIILPKVNTKSKLIAYLKKIAKNHINERLKLIAELFNFKYSSFSITSAKTCWGSCNSKNELHFTFKLIMCPEDVVDYIVLHELCHTKVKNHSKEFWKLVETCNPYYKINEQYLKKNRGIIEMI